MSAPLAKHLHPGNIVRFRQREWVVLPGGNKDTAQLRPLGGGEDCTINLAFTESAGNFLPDEIPAEAKFPLPALENIQDYDAFRLLLHSSRILLKDAAAPLKSLAKISIRPKAYQLAPLTMALKTSSIRMLIADDVGIGKTIEALLIAKELYLRGDIRSIGVLAPPWLCDQWEAEMRNKFHFDPVVIRSHTLARLERQKINADHSVFRAFPIFIASIDLVKGEKYKDTLLRDAPDLLIVDEVHGAARPAARNSQGIQQLRYQLLRELADKKDQNLILLSATPHSGMEESFKSLLGLLDDRFEDFDLAQLKDGDARILALHIIQRKRHDIKAWETEGSLFPERVGGDQGHPYRFSTEYQKFFTGIHSLAGKLVEDSASMEAFGRRMRYWSILALLRCVVSSPAAAEATLINRGAQGYSDPEANEADNLTQADTLGKTAVLENAEGETSDAVTGIYSLKPEEKAQLTKFAREAAVLKGDKDSKLLELCKILERLLADGFSPIVWCRYIATAEYLETELATRLKKTKAEIKAVTGNLGDEERRAAIAELSEYEKRILVATDCLSEGINLQAGFNAIVHYDLPWNPNRLEQREGRVDRFGQRHPVIKVVTLFGDNPVDLAVYEILIRKANQIRKDLGVHVPVPVEAEKVTEMMVNAILRRQANATQAVLFEDVEIKAKLDEFNMNWEKNKEAALKVRTKFAPRDREAMANAVMELEQSDQILGKSEYVAEFTRKALERVKVVLTEETTAAETAYVVAPSAAPNQLVADFVPAVAKRKQRPKTITFVSPGPEGTEFIGRNHPIVQTLASYFFEEAFFGKDTVLQSARCSVIRTKQVDIATHFVLLQPRYLLKEGKDIKGMLEECLLVGFTLNKKQVNLVDFNEAERLVLSLKATKNVAQQSLKSEAIKHALDIWPEVQGLVLPALNARAEAHAQSHGRLNTALREKKRQIQLQGEPDLLGVLVALPETK